MDEQQVSEASPASAGSSLRTAGVYDRIYALIERIPPGRVATYGQIARIEGHCTARMVGYALSTTPDGLNLPWQRVLNSAGRLSERRGGGTDRQRELLSAEGVVFNARGRLDFEQFGWAGPDVAWMDRHGFNPAAPPGRPRTHRQMKS